MIVGSGINALVCAALLARKGRRVHVVERNDRIGGCIRTAELSLPGFRHDVLSQWYTLFLLSPAYAALGEDLHRYGLEFVHAETPTGALLADDNGFVLQKDRHVNIAAMNALAPGDGDRYAEAMRFVEKHAELTFATLGEELWRPHYLKILAKTGLRTGPRKLTADARHFVQSARHWLGHAFQSEAVRACFAPWVLHAGLSPDAAFSAHLAKVIAFSLEAAGTPVVKGGSDHLLAAFQQFIEAQGGSIQTEFDVDEVLVRNSRAYGVRSVDGETIAANAGVICSMPPTQLYNRLLDKQQLPEALRAEVNTFRFGLSDMQIHLALDAVPQWRNAAMEKVAIVHVSGGVDAISRSVNEASRGLLPAEATIVVGQPSMVDPSRAPAGKAILWLQLQELPARVQGDAAGALDTPADGCWTTELREAYADRIIKRLAEHIPKLQSIILKRVVLSPADLESININLVGGDPYSGDCSIDQFLWWRPLPSTKNHDTPIKDLYHIGASTHPGPGLGAGSGYALGMSLR